MSSSCQDARIVGRELVKKLSGNGWFIGIIITPCKPHNFIICSEEGNTPKVVEIVKQFLDEVFDGDILLGVYGELTVRIFPESGASAERFYKMWVERQNKCSCKWGM